MRPSDYSEEILFTWWRRGKVENGEVGQAAFDLGHHGMTESSFWECHLPNPLLRVAKATLELVISFDFFIHCMRLLCTAVSPVQPKEILLIPISSANRTNPCPSENHQIWALRMAFKLL
jgi:hypothetical protein